MFIIENGGYYMEGIGFVGALQLIFITLKLVGVIKWPWVAVLIPTWISLVLTLILIGILLVAENIDDSEEQK